MKPNHKTVITMCVFAAIFLLIGTLAPIIYASYIPQSEIVQVERFEPTDTTVNSEFHNICWDRDSQETRPATIRTELILLSNNEEQEITRTVRNDIIEKGDKHISVRSKLPDNLQTGTYEYNAILEVQMADGRVERKLTFTSETFTVHQNKSSLSQTNHSSC